MCEFNMKPYKQYPEADLQPNQTLVNMFIDKFEEVNAWGWAYWLWNFRPHTNPNFNLISVSKEENIQPTLNFGFIRNAVVSLESGNQISTLDSDGTTSLKGIQSFKANSSSTSSETTTMLKKIEEDTIFPTVNITTVATTRPVGNTVLVSS